jgi:alkenylglycerophosphocholine/alkenylglycerophosphoethanolamine hydrolase
MQRKFPTLQTLPTAILALIGLGAVAAFMVGFWTDDITLRLVAKPLPVICMLVWTGLHGRSVYSWLIAAGLALSLAGDMFLEVQADLFLFGLIAFLLAHLGYIGAAVSDTRKLAPLRALPFAIWVVGLYLWLLPGMHDLALPVAVYVTVIGVMLWRMAARTDHRPSTWLALAGAMSFAFSDSIIAFRKFDGDFTGAREAIMMLYWLGQLGISASIVRWGSEEGDN